MNTFSLGQSKGFILSGAVGVGKTFILASITRALALRGLKVRFVDFFQLLSEIRDAYASKESEMDLIQPLVDLDVLVIDEMGKGPSTEWPTTILDQLVDGRDKQKKLIIASTNYTIGSPRSVQSYSSMDLEHAAASGPKGFSPDVFPPLESRVGPRIYSRLMGMCHTVELTGQDWRRNGRGGSVPRR
jgi:DNA replication protein DnaC